MKINNIRRLLSILLIFLLLLATIFFIVTSFSMPNIHQSFLNKLFSANVFVHLIFNFIIIVIIAKECYIQSSNNREDMCTSPLNCLAAYEMEEYIGKTSNNNNENDNVMIYMDDGREGDEDDNKTDHYRGLDGYYVNNDNEVDDENNGRNGEIGWQEDYEEEEYDYESERRIIEAFIAKDDNVMICMEDSDDNGGDDDKTDHYHGLDGYYVEDDDEVDDENNGRHCERSWEEEYDKGEYDYELEMKVEAFIAKVISGWKVESFYENITK